MHRFIPKNKKGQKKIKENFFDRHSIHASKTGFEKTIDDLIGTYGRSKYLIEKIKKRNLKEDDLNETESLAIEIASEYGNGQFYEENGPEIKKKMVDPKTPIGEALYRFINQTLIEYALEETEELNQIIHERYGKKTEKDEAVRKIYKDIRSISSSLEINEQYKKDLILFYLRRKINPEYYQAAAGIFSAEIIVRMTGQVPFALNDLFFTLYKERLSLFFTPKKNSP